ncbi:MAG: MerR family transcriptional regulator [Geodermatophilaceae bacterium]|nr:MerR family transcriptional regulator [Geodermatophilaceae bacterium]
MQVSIGDFSRMTYLSVKALRHYHDIGLLEPADIDPFTGYRRYRTTQVPSAQVIRRLRELGMPLHDVKAVLNAPDVAARNAAITAHLQRMERQLEQTQAVVASLRVLLETTDTPALVEYRSIPATPAVAIRARVSMSDLDAWSAAAFDELHGVVASGMHRAGPDGALYYNELFEAEVGDVTAFVPVLGAPPVTGRARPLELAAAEFAVMMHRGPYRDLDRTYGALGTVVTERALGVDGPIREHFLVSADDTPDDTAHRAEVCWPIFRTTART